MASVKPFSKPQAPKNSEQQVNAHSDNRQKAIVKKKALKNIFKGIWAENIFKVQFRSNILSLDAS